MLIPPLEAEYLGTKESSLLQLSDSSLPPLRLYTFQDEAPFVIRRRHRVNPPDSFLEVYASQIPPFFPIPSLFDSVLPFKARWVRQQLQHVPPSLRAHDRILPELFYFSAAACVQSILILRERRWVTSFLLRVCKPKPSLQPLLRQPPKTPSQILDLARDLHFVAYFLT